MRKVEILLIFRFLIEAFMVSICPAVKRVQIFTVLALLGDLLRMRHELFLGFCYGAEYFVDLELIRCGFQERR
jgi:hypothetical protein